MTKDRRFGVKSFLTGEENDILSIPFSFSNSDPEMIHINSSPEAPPPRIRILDTRSHEVETVRIGDRLTFRIEIPEDSTSWFFLIEFSYFLQN